jgi:putative DNA primase/helicase
MTTLRLVPDAHDNDPGDEGFEEMSDDRDREGPTGPVARCFYPCTDTGNGERFAAQHRGRAIFVPAWGQWAVHDGQHFVGDPGNVHVGALAKQTLRAIYGEAERATDDKVRTAIATWAKKSEERARREAMIALARSEPGIAVEHTALDADPWSFNVLNGTIDLCRGKLRPHRASDLITKLAGVHYDEKATCPRFERFLHEIMAGDGDRIEFLRRFLGYALSGDVREHAFCFWYGPKGGNGKSTLTELLFWVMGGYAIKSAPDLLFRSEHQDRHPTELADLFRARLVVCNETSGKRTWDDSVVKDVTGGDVVKARRMRENFWSFEPTHKLLVFGNHKPHLANPDDGGMRRRLRLVPFDVSFTGNPNRRLGEELRSEAPGILAYLVRGCLDWQKHGLTEPPVIVAATGAYFAEEDTIGRFVIECCDLDPTARITAKALRDANATWADEAGERPATAKAMATWLQNHGVSPKSVRTEKGPRHGWIGLRLRELADRSSDVTGGQCDLPS